MLAISPVVIQPQSTGSLELRSTDPLDSVRIDPNYLSDRRDVDLLVAGFRLARRIAATAPLSDHVDVELIPGPHVQTDGEIEAFVRARSRSLQHLAGTCKMGNDDLAVVDPYLRVRGVEGLRVVDASVLPNITRGHLNAPAVMIAERAADMISSRADSPPAVISPH
jgi:choline dehydrogenase